MIFEGFTAVNVWIMAFFGVMHSALKMGVACFSEAFVITKKITRRHNPEDYKLHYLKMFVYFYRRTPNDSKRFTARGPPVRSPLKASGNYVYHAL
jgi:hypothetical protein